MVKLKLIGSHCLSISLYAIESLNMKKSDMVTLNSWWNFVCRMLFKYHKWDYVRELIHMLNRLDLHHINLRQLLLVKSMILNNGHIVAVLSIMRYYVCWVVCKTVFYQFSFDHPYSKNLTCSEPLTALGITFDRFLKWDSFVSKTVCSCNFHLRSFFYLRSKLGPKLCAIVARTVALSNLNYCNSLLCGVSAFCNQY